METLLEIRNLETHFETDRGIVRAVNNLDLLVHRGECFGIVGESGSGKSVLSLSIMRLVSSPGKTVGGRILFHSKKDNNTCDLLTLSGDGIRRVRGSKIAMIFQEPMTSLNPVFTIENQIAEAVRLHQPRLSGKEVRETVLDSLEKVLISDPKRVAQAYPHELSGGMRQRVMIAMALSCGPELLIADEPTTALDVTIQAQILELLRHLQESLHMTVLLITHDLGVVAETVDRMAVMYAGQIVEQGPVRELFGAPAHPYTAALLKSVPHGQTGTRLLSISGQVPDLAQLPPGCAFQNRCAFVKERCQNENPSLVSPDETRSVRCFYPCS